jgi:hypothetical protein
LKLLKRGEHAEICNLFISENINSAEILESILKSALKLRQNSYIVAIYKKLLTLNSSIAKKFSNDVKPFMPDIRYTRKLS